MKKIVSLLMVMLLAVSAATALSGCDSAPSITVYNWGQYISDGTDDTLDIIKEFENETGIKVKYRTFEHNEGMYAKISTGAGKYDVIFPSDYMVARLISENLLEKLDFSNIPDFQNIMDEFKNPVYDPKNEYSVPYAWGTVGIIYNKNMVTQPVDSWNILWNEKYKGQILMFNNPRDAFGIALKKLGFSQNTTDRAQLTAAAEELKKQKPLLQAYVMDEIFDKMINGEAALAPYYAGDFLTMADQNSDLEFVLPAEGSNKFVDAMCVPKGSKHKREAEMFINFMLKADIGKANIEYIGYSTPNKAVYDILDDEVKSDVISYPSAETLSKCENFINLPKDANTLMQDLWIDIKAAD